MSIRVVDPTCVKCHKPLTDPLSRALKLGPECRKGMSAVQLRDAMARAAERDDPFRIPEERPASLEARVNNQRARLAVAPLIEDTTEAEDSADVEPRSGLKVCPRHGSLANNCPECRWENEHKNASVRILREVLASPLEARRAERIAVQTARRQRGIPAPASRPAPRPSLRRPAARRTVPAAPTTQQLELL